MTIELENFRSGNELRFRLISVQRAAERGTAGIPDLVRHLADPSDEVANAAAGALHSLAPLAALPERWASAVPSATGHEAVPAWLRRLCEGPGSEEGLGTLAAEQARTLGPAELDRFLDRLAVFQGMQRSFHAALAGSGLKEAARRFSRKVLALRRLQYPLQVSLSATMACQLRCDFCIADDSQNEASKALSDDDLRSLFSWMGRHGVTRLSLTGGEPTLYPRFAQLLTELRERSIELNVATNGQFSDAILHEIVRSRPLCVSMHLAPEVRDDKLDRFLGHARALVSEGIYTIIRCNLPRPDTEHRRFIDAALSAGIPEIRTAIPMPNAYRVNRYTEPAEFTGFRDLLSSFVRDARRERLELRLSKPYPICLFDEPAARVFLGNGSLTTDCPVHQTAFTNNLVIYPDLSFSPCLGLNVKVRRRIVEFPGLRTAALQYRSAVAGLMRRPLFEHCTACPLSNGGRCLGACLSYRPDPLALFS